MSRLAGLSHGAVAVLTAALLASTTSVAYADTAGEVPGPDEAAQVPELTWEGCALTPEAAAVECATAQLPLDYDRPDGDQVEIAVARVPATNPEQRIGSLFFNLGGPGGPSVEFLQTAGSGWFAALNERFDIVGFDPRGVGQSSPDVDCKVDQETEGMSQRPTPTPVDLDADAVVDHAQRYVDDCLDANGEILAHLSTANVARDMDALRAAVGDEKLTYLGFSYGTFLGATYAALFPERYRAVVLDGALDPDQYITDPVSFASLQAAAFERALDRFLVACATDQTACAGFGNGDPFPAYDALLASAAATPIPAERYTDDPRPVTADDIRDITLVLLYSKQAWGILAAALAEAEAGDASLVRAVFDLVVSPREDDGSFDPQNDRFFAITAGEQHWSTDVDAYLERGAREWVEFPHFWGSFAYSEIVYALWPEKDEDAYAGSFELPASSPTPVVIGTTYDPATPYSEAVGLARSLGNARLITMEGDGHTAYGRGNSACIDAATQAYLIDGTLPPEGLVCRHEVPFLPFESAVQTSAELSAEQLSAGGAGAVLSDAVGAVVAGAR